jgi:hypothetical protein
MANDYSNVIIDKRYILVFSIAVFSSWVLHEFAHWAAGELLGYKMAMTLNSSYPVDGKYLQNWHYQVISAAGPIFTLIEALLIFWLMIQRKRILLYPFIFTCFYMRFFATVISLLNPNDEARISKAIGLGKFTLPVIITTILFFLLYKISKVYNFEKKFNLANMGLVILFSSVIIMADSFFKIHLL